MANQYLKDSCAHNGPTDIVGDDTIWKDLPHELIEKCFSHLPVLVIASTLRAVNRAWNGYPGTSTFMALHNHGKNIDSCFGFLMFGTNILTHRCETMALDHNTLKWQLAPFLQLPGPYRACQVKSVSEGILLLTLHPDVSPPFIVWNPLLPSSCKQTINPIPLDNCWSVNMVVDKSNATFKILVFTSWFDDCHTFSSTTSSWTCHSERPSFCQGMFFPQCGEGGHITLSHQNCLYVAIGSLVGDVHRVGDLCYDASKNVWKKSSAMFTLSQEIMKSYGYCFTRSLFVVSNIMYKVVEYISGVHLIGDSRPSPTVQILARNLTINNAEMWKVIATTTLPQSNWETKWFGSWYGYIQEGHEKPTLCGLFKSEPHLFLMKYNTHNNKWATICVTNKGINGLDSSQEPIGIISRTRTLWGCRWTTNKRKWLSMKMARNYQPSWICPSSDYKHRSKVGIEDLSKFLV